MKKKPVLLILVAAVAVATGLVVYAMAPEPSSEAEGVETVSLEVRGMQSFMCEMAVKSSLKHLNGVTAVAVDRKVGKADVTYDPSAVAPSAFVEAVNATGFRALLPAGLASQPGAVARARALETAVPIGHPASRTILAPDQIARVADFIAEAILETQETPSGKTIEEATGVELSIADTPILQQAVLSRLAGDPEGQELLEGSRCSDYGACSLWGSLAGASGATLAMFEEEKALDGTTYEDLSLPAFEARNLAGETVHSENLAGRPAVLAFLAVHCTHSMDTFPILQELHRRYSAEGLQVVGILINSGSVEDANGWIPYFEPEYPIWVASDDSLGDLVGSHLVPTYLLVDADGTIRKKLVGFKEQDSVTADLTLIQTSPAS